MYENLLKLCKQVAEKTNCNRIQIIGNEAALYKLGLSYNYNMLKSEDYDIEIVPCAFLQEDDKVFVIPGVKPVKIYYKD